MNITSFFAQVLGIIFLVMGIAIVAKPKYVQAALDEITRNKGVLWLCGFASLCMGAVMIVLHNYWMTGPQILITVLGWMALLKGAVILIMPERTVELYRDWNKNNVYMAAGVFAFVLGLVLVYLGMV